MSTSPDVPVSSDESAEIGPPPYYHRSDCHICMKQDGLENAPHFHLWLVPRQGEGALRGLAYLAQRPPLTCTFSDAEAMSQKIRSLVVV
jgi:hypothetical protein